MRQGFGSDQQVNAPFTTVVNDIADVADVADVVNVVNVVNPSPAQYGFLTNDA